MSQTNNSDQTIDLGRFEGDQPQQEIDNLYYIGRSKQRADFLRMLLDLPYKSSYLITGSRGSGKSSFVRHCLSVYEQNLMSRYLKGPRGRLFFWDHLFRLLLIGLLSAMMVVGYEFMLTLSPILYKKGFSLFKVFFLFFCFDSLIQQL